MIYKKIFLRLIILISLSSLIAYTFFTTVVNSNRYLLRSIDLDFSESNLIPARGSVISEDGISIATTQIYFNLLFKNSIPDKNIEEIKVKLANLNINTNIDLTDKVIAKDLTYEQLISVKSILVDYPQLYLKKYYKRNYPNPYAFSHILGYVSYNSDSDPKNKIYSQFEGKYRLEKIFDNYLKGTMGSESYSEGQKTSTPPIDGNDIYLTIDSNWQNSLYKILESESSIFYSAGAGGVVLETNTGKVKAMVSFPGFDLNKFQNGLTQEEYNSLIDNRDIPLQDKVVSLGYAPGSIFKVVTAYTLLTHNIIDYNTQYFSDRCIDLGSNQFCEFGKFFYGQMNVVRALYKSSNLFFCNFSKQLVEKESYDPIKDNATLFGLGNKTGINVENETQGNVDSPQYRFNTSKAIWYLGDTCNGVIGQGADLATPIQMAVVASAIKNGGDFYTPYYVNKIVDKNGSTVKSFGPELKKHENLYSDTLKIIREGMYDVANYPDGTVYPFLKSLPQFNIEAKTGTAEVVENINGNSSNKTNGWIIGSFDYNGTSYSFALMLPYGGSGFYMGSTLKHFLTCLNTNFEYNCENI